MRLGGKEKNVNFVVMNKMKLHIPLPKSFDRLEKVCEQLPVHERFLQLYVIDD